MRDREITVTGGGRGSDRRGKTQLDEAEPAIEETACERRLRRFLEVLRHLFQHVLNMESREESVGVLRR